MVDNNPQALRKVYFDAWHKHLKNLPLSPLEGIIVDIIERHPEYHLLFSQQNFNELKEEKFALDHNPFFHLALHVAIAEQIGANRPLGIREAFQDLLKKYQDKTTVEHKMMECLARVLVESASSVDEAHYLEAIKRLI